MATRLLHTAVVSDAGCLSVVLVWSVALGACGGEGSTAPGSSVNGAPAVTSVAPVVEPPPAPPLDPSRAVAVAHGAAFGCALRANGRVVCWGSNTQGTLGQGHTDPVEGAREVIGLEDAIAIAAGDSSACAVRAGGAVVCWGEGRSGELGGEGEQHSGGHLVPISEVSGAEAIWAGLSRYCVRVAEGVMCWGRRDAALDGSLPLSSDATPPHEVALEGVERMLLGWHQNHALLRDGRVLVWGPGPEAPVELAGARAALSRSSDEFVARIDGTVVRSTSGAAPVEIEALRGARELVECASRVVGLTDDGRLLSFSPYDDTPASFERGDDLAALARGEGGLVALTRAGGVRMWSQAGSTGRSFVAHDLVMPPTGVVPPAPPPPSGPLPPWCTLELRAVTPRSASSLTALWEVVGRDPHLDDPPPADDAEARAWLCESLRGSLSGCARGGPITFARPNYEGTGLAWIDADGTARWVDQLGTVSDGTEEASFLERVEVRSSATLEVSFEYSEAEQSCFGEEGDETCGLDEVRRRVFVVLGRGASALVAELELDVDTMREVGTGPPSGLPSPRMRVEDDTVVVEACGGIARRPLPEPPAPAPSSGAAGPIPAAADAVPEAPAPIPEPALPPPSSADVEAAAQQCGSGFARIGAGDLPGARREIETALRVLERAEGERAHRSLGACLYNLGRVDEGEGDLGGARAAYRRSLEVRPNATVQERLRGLEP
ncbi:MAG: hypothetical protein U0353_29110 [Sandaracinus sp.]